MISYNTALALLGTSLLGASAGAVGQFAVLRGRALAGDALAHASLPGLCLAFWFVGERNLPSMLFGAFLSGVIGILIIAALRRWTRVKEDAAIGIVLSVFFGFGMVLVRLIQNRVEGGNKAGLSTYILGSTAGIIAQDVYLIAGLAVASLVSILLIYKEFKLVVFDAGFGHAQGWPVFRLDLWLMSLVAVTVVIGLPAVGVVMIAALLIIPAAAARFWSNRLGVVVVLSSLFGGAIGLIGTTLSAHFDKLPTGPVIVLVGAALFVISMLFAPRRGLLAAAAAQTRFRRELKEQTLLGVLLHMLEPDPAADRALSEPDILARKPFRPAELRRLLGRLIHRGYLRPLASGSYALTPRGLARSLEIARTGFVASEAR